jgi:4-hydroxy-2-oxoheptanedioate aldolase
MVEHRHEHETDRERNHGFPYTPTIMRENTLKLRLYAGQPAFGVMCTFPSPPVVEMLGHLGFDWILLDNEHGSITVDSAEACIAAAELTGMAPIVRPVGNKPEIIAPFLDRGAWGVQVPHVNTADEARAAVDAVKYAPEGHRGIFSGGRPAGYGYKGTPAEYAKDANRQTLVCLMLEEVEAIENLPELVKVPGVDVYFIGSGDLSQSMGYTGQQAHPEVQKLMERGVAAITGAGRIAGCSCPDTLIPKFLGLGVQYFHSTVGRLLQQSSESYLKTVRQAAADAGR